jgi:hypothetical protein
LVDIKAAHRTAAFPHKNLRSRGRLEGRPFAIMPLVPEYEGMLKRKAPVSHPGVCTYATDSFFSLGATVSAGDRSGYQEK